jgi:EAL and modified HD-GYP domain-containing signal transduction protein
LRVYACGAILAEVTELYAYVGRQAIFEPSLKVVAYELLYRDSFENRAKFSDVDQAAAATMLNALVEIGLDALAGSVPVFLNLPGSFLLGRYPIPFEPARAVLEVLENVPVTPELVEALRELKARGFKIALDDFVLDDRTRPLVAVADIVKLDVLNVERATIASRVAELRPSGVKLLAEKVSTHDEMEFLRTLDFDYYQGFFLEKPIISRTRRLPHHRATLVQLLAKLYDPKVDLRVIERLLAGDVGMTVRLLRLASSAAMSRGVPVGTIAQAIQRLGMRQVAALVVVVMVSGFDDKPMELITESLVRAKLCELLAARTNVATPDELFTAGLLSLLDAMLDQPLAELLRQLPITPLITDALSGSGSPASKIVEAARAQERCDFETIVELGLQSSVVTKAWRDAVAWARELIALL